MFRSIFNLIRKIIHNNVVLVLKYEKYYYVLHCNAIKHWYGGHWEELIDDETLYTYSRAKALVIAHNKQRKLNTLFGVREA